jgi:glycosyltransferase involved in cell wall biosynthesis
MSAAPRAARPLRALHVFSTFVPAGPQVRAVALMRALGGGFDHAVVAMDGRTAATELARPDVALRIVPPPPKAGTPATVLRMRALIEREAPDLVLTYNFGAIDSVLAARSLGLERVVHHEDGFLPDEAQGLKSRRTWLRRIALAGTHVVVISRNLERIALERWRLEPARVHFVPNGIDTSRFAPRDGNVPLRDALGIPRSSIVVGAVGHLRPEKNFARLLRAVAAAIPGVDLRVLLLGEGPERAALEGLARAPELSGRVVFAGYHADPRAHYRAMDVFAITSDTEQMPISLLEAMATSLPVVATRVGDVAEVLADEQRPFVVPLGQGCERELARALAELGSGADLRARLGAANRSRAAAEFGFERMVARYRNLYGAVALGHSPAP